MGEPLRTVTTSDGRVLAFAVWGEPDGFPVLALHGTPGCRLERWPDEELYRRLGVWFVRHDRAGYGRSTRRRGRPIVDEVDDVAGPISGRTREQDIGENVRWLRDGVLPPASRKGWSRQAARGTRPPRLLG